jgi:two-component system NtrC family sensor kinase
MRNWLKLRFTSLGTRLLLPLILAIGVVVAVYAVLSFRSVKENFLAFAGAEAERSSELIRRATHDGMLLHRLDEVQVILERVAEGPEFAVVRVYDKRGEVVLSSAQTEIGQELGLQAPPCSSCHPVGEPEGALQEAVDVIRAGDEEVLRRVSVIRNDPGCTSGGCHEAEAGHPVLGVLEVEMSLQPLEAALASERRQLIWTTVALLLAIGGVTAVSFRRLIYRPIGLLQEGARRIADGDLSTRIDVEGEHELASLAGDFNRMAEDLKRMQGELTEWSQRLEQKVVQKTSELRAAQVQVLHMEKMASLGKLSATVAHELNNPISGILTYSRLVERELAEQPMGAEKREELERYLHLVQRECVRCGTIVQNLVAFGRRGSTEMKAVEVNQVLERSIMLIRHHLEISGITLRTEPMVGDNQIVADSGQLEQALVALCVNAVEAMPDGGELRVMADGDDDHVVFSVEDTGTGMEPEVLRQAFEPFFSTKLHESGAGLGLSVVYGIVHRHGGAIEIDSEVGRGTTIRIRVPRNPPADAKDEQASATGEALSASTRA